MTSVNAVARQVRYSRLLEEGDFRGRTANYVLMLAFGALVISLVASWINVLFLGSALTFMMAYVWGRRNENVRVRMKENAKPCPTVAGPAAATIV
jgi:hypothetical protein